MTILALIAFLPIFTFGQEMLVGTYNVRYKNKNDSINGELWSKRCQVICDQVNFMAPAIFGTQEVLHEQLIDLLNSLDGYDYIGVGRDDGAKEGEYAAIFYQKNRLSLLDHGDFWLSETPDSPHLGWDAACIRICTWGKFSDRMTEKEFFFFNLHMDHEGKVARREGARLVVSKIRDIAGEAPVILTGDFNVDQTDEIYSIFTNSGILKDSYSSAQIRFAENGTFNNFDPRMKTDSRIDHVFVSPSTQVKAYGLLTDSYWIKGVIHHPSDHYPVFVRIGLPENTHE